MVDLKMAATCPGFATGEKIMEEEGDQEKKKRNIGKKKSKILRAERRIYSRNIIQSNKNALCLKIKYGICAPLIHYALALF